MLQQLHICHHPAGALQVFLLCYYREFQLIIDATSREPNPQHDTLTPYILRGVEHDNGLCYEFFQEALSRFDDDDTLEPLFTKAMVDISTKLATLSMNDNYKSSVMVSELSLEDYRR